MIITTLFVESRASSPGHGDAGVRGTGEIREVPVEAIYRAVGYFGSPLEGIPFDEKHGVIPNREGQVLHTSDNSRMYGVYATGWIKRGPVGLIGHTNLYLAKMTGPGRVGIQSMYVHHHTD